MTYQFSKSTQQRQKCITENMKFTTQQF